MSFVSIDDAFPELDNRYQKKGSGSGGTYQDPVTGSLIPLNEIGGAGNTRGDHAVDLQSDVATAVRVASGDHATVGGGDNNTASGDHSTVPGGQYCNAGAPNAYANGNNCTVTGTNGVAEGSYCTVGSNHGRATGRLGSTIIEGDDTRGYVIAANQSCHLHNVALGIRLDNTSEAELVANAGAGNRIPVTAGSVIGYKGKAYMRGHDGEKALIGAWDVEGVISRTVSGSVVMDSYSVTRTVENGVATLRGEADTVNESLAFFASSADAGANPDRVIVGLILKLERL